MRVRVATADDTARLVEMATRFLAESLYGRLFPVDEPRLAGLVATCMTLGVIFVAEVETGIVGMLALIELTDPIAGLLYADEQAWWVEPEHRAGLIGPRLRFRARAWAMGRGCTFIRWVAPVNAPGVAAFLERVGCEAIETSFIERI